ncbi:MAG TPA: 5'-3' exonuclease H3TH domain-containing protein [Kofleriaceae bacterium]|nr:5'-3' exonuclease H3TH domain-containing protein [Kofleriaceae bacterium]
MSTILLVDLPSVLFPIYHVSGKETDVDYVSRATVARIRGLAAGYDHTAICCDAGRSFRKDISPEYKSTRPERDEALTHQLRVAEETLAADGFPVFSVKGFEADDLIATATTWARAQEPPHDIVVASSDKDLLQLVGEGVRAYSIRNDTILGPDEVIAKFGVRPDQMRDWLILVGDKSDNVKGIPGVGEKRATELLTRFSSLRDLFRLVGSTSAENSGLTPAIYKAILEGVETAELARKLITLRTDAPIDPAIILTPRIPRDVPQIADAEFDEEEPSEEDTVETIDQDTGEVTADVQTIEPPTAPEPSKGDPRQVDPPSTGMIVRPPSWELALEPTNAGTAYKLAAHIFNSRLFSNMPNADAVFTVILMGRTLGIDALTMLRNVHVIEGKVTLAAPLIVGLVLRSGKADYFKCTTTTNEKAVYKTHRKGDPDPDPTILEYTIDDAKRQQLLMPIEPNKKPGNWHKIPKTMLRHRCSTELARAVYPDVVAGLYSPDEFGVDVRVEEHAA